jgi:hypothetical protein
MPPRAIPVRLQEVGASSPRASTRFVGRAFKRDIHFARTRRASAPEKSFFPQAATVRTVAVFPDFSPHLTPLFLASSPTPLPAPATYPWTNSFWLIGLRPLAPLFAAFFTLLFFLFSSLQTLFCTTGG